jgi:O-6-methylguanine DNA methyltransferase
MNTIEMDTPNALRDYDMVRRCLAYLTENWRDQPSLEELAGRSGIGAHHLQRLFTRWARLTPKAFLQAITIDHARKLLRDSVGLCGLAFADPGEEAKTLADMMGRWPEAVYAESHAATLPYARRIFEVENWSADQPLRIVFIGSDFEIRVWETLLRIPFGRASTYSDIAKHLGKPSAARAVGTAVGKNPLSFVVPCHRVLGKSGGLCGYHWGLTRKRAILGWEAGVSARAA